MIKGLIDFACDQLSEFVGKGATKIIFKPDSKPAENYKELIYEESIENNRNTYTRNIFDISYIKDKLEGFTDKNYIEIKGNDYTKYGSDIIPSEDRLTKKNHLFSPLGNLILAELSSAYLKPKLLVDNIYSDVHFFKKYNFEWTYTNKYDEKEDHSDINTFLLDDKYVLFNNIGYNKSISQYKFYTEIQKVEKI